MYTLARSDKFVLPNKFPALIAAYDLDHTIIVPKSNRKFPINIDDWRLVAPVVDRLRAEAAAGYTIVVFTNQKLMSPQDITTKFLKVVEAIGVPMMMLAGHANHYYRKPHTGLWEVFLAELRANAFPADAFPDDPVPSDDLVHPDSFFCGDMVTDGKFAYNVGLKYIQVLEPLDGDDWPHPLKQHVVVEENPFANLLTSLTTGLLEDPIKEANFDLSEFAEPNFDKSKFAESHQPFLLIMVGPPASGKSSAARLISKYVDRHFTNPMNRNLPYGQVQIINNDAFTELHALEKTTLPLRQRKSVAAMIKTAYAYAFISRHSIIDDNTNATVEKRKQLIDLAISNNYRPFILFFDLPFEISSALNEFRCEQTKGSVSLPDVALRTYYKRLNKPDVLEILQAEFQAFLQTEPPANPLANPPANPPAKPPADLPYYVTRQIIVKTEEERLELTSKVF